LLVNRFQFLVHSLGTIGRYMEGTFVVRYFKQMLPTKWRRCQLGIGSAVGRLAPPVKVCVKHFCETFLLKLNYKINVDLNFFCFLPYIYIFRS
jgi:hypothetical protein